MQNSLFHKFFHLLYAVKFLFILSLVSTVFAKQFDGAAITVIADHPRKHIPIVLLAKQLSLFGGNYLNFGGYTETGEEPAACAARQLYFESLSFFNITPDELKNAPYVDFEKKPGHFFRNYFIYVEHVPISKIVAVLKKLHIDSEYARADYRGCKVREFNGEGCHAIKTVHDYLENKAFVWIPLKEFIDHLQNQTPLVGKIGVCVKQLPGEKGEIAFDPKRDFEGKDYASLSILRVQAPIVLRSSFVKALSNPYAIEILKSFLDNTIKAPKAKTSLHGISYSDIEGSES